MLVSGVQQSDSVIHIHVYIYVYIYECVCVYIYKLFFRFFSIIGYSYDIPGQKEGGRLFLMKEESININIMCNTRLTMGRTESSSDAL